MTHLTLEQLLLTREPGLEPGVHVLREHVMQCQICQDELTRLDQRVARMKALPTLRPSRDRFAEIRSRTTAERRTRRFRWAAGGTIALAASLALAVWIGGRGHGQDRILERVNPTGTNTELTEIINRSHELERALSAYDPDRQVVDGRAVSMTTSLENRLAQVDQELQVVDFLDANVRQREALRLWRERVGLLDALVDLHMTGARYIGF
jgi:hypothetical protein